MPERDLRSVGNTGDLDLRGCNRSALSIAQDFAALVEILERQLKLVSPADDDIRSHLSKARDAAKRGARLSDELVQQTRSSS